MQATHLTSQAPLEARSQDAWLRGCVMDVIRASGGNGCSDVLRYDGVQPSTACSAATVKGHELWAACYAKLGQALANTNSQRRRAEEGSDCARSRGGSWRTVS